ncbi:MAG TPA: hypothetical protein VFX54_11955 [Candidatus Binatia bacterium]|nr:hypothetical protein [Candidatus Binatia bacterium]
MTNSSGLPSRLEVDGIIGLDAQPALRNLRITQCYHDLSHSFATLFDDVNVNWCTFANWASKTAGRFVRGELVGIFRDAVQSDRLLADKLDRLNQWIRRINGSSIVSQLVIFEALKAPVMEVSRYVTAGNLAVFAELAPMFSVMCARFERETIYDAGSLTRLLDELELKTGTPERGGQSLLRAAVGHFYQARFTSDPKQRAELILLANAQTGLHEQVRLQPAIAGSLKLPFEPALRALLDGIFRGAGRPTADLPAILEKTAKPMFAEVDHDLNRIWRRCATRIFMTLRLPEGEIHLGKDFRGSPGRELFPSLLQSIEMIDLRNLLASYRADGGTADESGAADWAEIGERMHFILTLFRARQQDQQLFDQPFSDKQRIDIAAGLLPQGAL